MSTQSTTQEADSIETQTTKDLTSFGWGSATNKIGNELPGNLGIVADTLEEAGEFTVHLTSGNSFTFEFHGELNPVLETLYLYLKGTDGDFKGVIVYHEKSETWSCDVTELGTHANVTVECMTTIERIEAGADTFVNGGERL